MKLCEIDNAVLAAHEGGRDCKTVPGIRSARRFGRVLARAKRRKAAKLLVHLNTDVIAIRAS
jgi:hypothetical protein